MMGMKKRAKRMGGGAMKKRIGKMGGGAMKKRVKRKDGSLKPIPAGNKGLAKLDVEVRNKMGYAKKGGRIKAAAGTHVTKEGKRAKKGLWYNINQKQKRIAAGSGEKMRKPGSKGAPTAKAIKKSQA